MLPGPDAAQEKSLVWAHASRKNVTPGVQQAYAVIEVQVSAPRSSLAWKSLPRFKGLVVRRASNNRAHVTAVSLERMVRNEGNIVIDQPAPILPKADTAASPESTSTAADPLIAAPSPVVPSSFGIYAVSEGKLYELDLLPGRSPDARIAILSLIATNSRATLPDGHLTFIVYRRDSATTAADRAEVWLIAKIEREASFDKKGKQVVTGVDDNWVMRNISIPYRTAPKKGQS